VVAYSSGNHAQAVAIAARHAGISATLVMPADAPRSKVEATQAQGARIVLYDRLRESREEIGRRIAGETGATLVPPFDHPWIIAGQGTCALEFLEQAPDLDALVVCLGGGGLLAGCAIAAKALRPNIRVYGVEPELANDYWLSLQRGEPVEIPPPATIADGLRTTKPGRWNFPVIQRLADGVLLVSEEEIREAAKIHPHADEAGGRAERGRRRGRRAGAQAARRLPPRGRGAERRQRGSGDARVAVGYGTAGRPAATRSRRAREHAWQARISGRGRRRPVWRA
jgi:threonine dehydratase